MKGYVAFLQMEQQSGLRCAHAGMQAGCYYVYDGKDFRYVDGAHEADVLVHGVALQRDDWYRVFDRDDVLAQWLEAEAEAHVRRFANAGEFEMSVAAAYAHGLERCARLLKERSGA